MMKKYSFLIASAMSASLLLAACGTTDNTTPNEDKNTTDFVEPTVTQETPVADSTTPDTVDDVTTSIKEQPKTNTSTSTDTGTNSEAPTTTNYTSSPEQNYKIALQQDFSLVAEEPGRDMIVYDADDQISMRIQTFATTETTYEEIAQQVKETTEITAPEGQFTTVDLAAFLSANTEVQNAVGYKIVYTEDAEQSVTVVFTKANKIVQLTVFDTTAETFTENLLAMGFSIK